MRMVNYEARMKSLFTKWEVKNLLYAYNPKNPEDFVIDSGIFYWKSYVFLVSGFFRLFLEYINWFNGYTSLHK